MAVQLPAGSARPAFEVQLLVSLGAQEFRKISLVPIIWLVIRTQLVALITRRLGVQWPANVTVLLTLPIRITPSPVKVPLVTLPWGSLVNRCLILVRIPLTRVLLAAIKSIRSLILRLVRDKRLVVIKVGWVAVLVNILILEGFVGTLTVILRSDIRRPVVTIHRPFGLKTPQIPGISLALQVTVFTVRILLVPKTWPILVTWVVYRTVGRIPFLWPGGA